MCGILAGISFDQSLRYKESLEIVSYRGPDATGLKLFERNDYQIVLGHKRLAIIDLNPRSNQPLCVNNHYWITFNGEIYNYLELRKQLESFGFSFFTNTDTEVLLNAYVYWGREVLNRLNGMFSFCIFDSKKNELFVARDRYGVKPLYYAYHPDKGLFFSSEIKQLLELGISNKKTNFKALASYLLAGDFSFDQNTMVNDIYEFPEAHFFIINSDELTQNRGSDLNFTKWYFIESIIDNQGSNGKDLKEYEELLKDAVSIRLRSDVPIGGLLSGGVDSSVIALMMRQLNQGSQSFLTAGFNNNKYDETYYADLVAKSLNLDHRVLQITENDAVNIIDELAFFYDSPIPGRSAIPHYLLYKSVKEMDIKVCLEGQGADESLCGYTSFQYAYMVELLKNVHFIRLWKELVSFSKNESVTKYYVEKEIFSRLFYNFSAASELSNYQNYFSINVKEINYIKRKSLNIESALTSRFQILKSILHSVDRVSMASSIETRVPFLDYRLVEAFILAPVDMKIKNGYRKVILRNIMQGKLPNQITHRSDKMGFSSPEAFWVKNKLADQVLLYLKTSSSLGVVNTDYLVKKYLDFLSGRGAYDSIFWRVYSFMKWKEVFNISY